MAALDKFEQKLAGELTFLLPQEKIKVISAIRKLAQSLLTEYYVEIMDEIWAFFNTNRERVVYRKKVLFWTIELKFKHLEQLLRFLVSKGRFGSASVAST